jgi:hypothetical protein
MTPDLNPHASIPLSPLISDPLFLAPSIEQAGTGTPDRIALCREAGWPEPLIPRKPPPVKRVY